MRKMGEQSVNKKLITVLWSLYIQSSFMVWWQSRGHHDIKVHFTVNKLKIVEVPLMRSKLKIDVVS